VIAFAAWKSLIPAAARFHVARANQGLWPHGSLGVNG
jgi:hypothetical protein